RDMPDIRHFEHVHIRVEDLQKCLDFYTDVMGLVKLGEADGVHYLGCGMDDRYDLAVSQGDAAVEHFAIRIPGGKDELDRYYHQLKQAGVDAYWVSDAEPGHPYAVRFRLPNRVTMELVNVEIPRYQRMDRPARRDRSVVAPLDADHITLQA